MCYRCLLWFKNGGGNGEFAFIKTGEKREEITLF